MLLPVKFNAMVESTVNSLEVFFNPRSVAIIGASGRPGSLGHGLVYNVLTTFKGPVYLVNVKGGVILGRNSYKKISDLPESVDLALIITPATAVLDVLEDSNAVGVRGAIVYSGGFSEVGNESLEAEVVKIARRHGIRLLGPNCVGVIDTRTPLNATFISAERQLIPGPGFLSIVSQSGALGSLILDFIGERLIGLRRFTSIGNASDVKMWELLEFLALDPETRVIGLYMESVREGRELIETLKRVTSTKPVVVLAGGLSESGSKAASTHVAALTTNFKILDGALKQAGVIRAGNLEEFIAALEVLGKTALKPGGDRIVAVTNTGGMGVLLSDSMERRGLKLSPLSDDLRSKLRSIIPGYMAVGNPIDLSGAAPTELYRRVIEEILNLRAADILVLINQPQTVAMDVDAYIEYSRTLTKIDIPIIHLVSGSSYSRDLASKLRSLGFPVALSPEEASFMVYALIRTLKMEKGSDGTVEVKVDKAKAEKIITRALSESREFLGEHEAKELLEAYGFETPRYKVAGDCSEAVRAAESLGYPVVLKILSIRAVHKSDIGGIAVDLRDPNEVIQACHSIVNNARKAGIDFNGIIVEEHVKTVAEIALGAFKDRILGPPVMVGLGGYTVELLEDIAFRLAPLTVEEAIDMIQDTRVKRLINGYRGIRIDLDKMVEAVLRIEKLVWDNPEIVELDVNPLAITRDGRLVVLDAKVKLSKSR